MHANKTNIFKTKRFWLLAILLLIICFFAYQQLFYKSKQVNSNIFILKKVLPAHDNEIWTVKFSPDGKLFASGSVDSTVKVWDKETGNVILTLKQPAGITYLDFSRDGNYIATASYDAGVRLWKLPEGKLVKQFSKDSNTVWSVNFSPDGKMLASCGEDALVNLWDIETGLLIRSLQGHGKNIWDVKFSPDGKTLASGSFDKTIKIWNTAEGKLLTTLAEHTEAIVSLAFSHDGSKLVSTSDDQTIRFWNTANWSLINTLVTPEHTQAADFSPDDKYLVTGGRDKPMIGELLQNFFGDSKYNKGVSMRLWDAATGKLLQTFSQHSNDVNDVSFSPDGNSIVSASSDKTIGIWELKEKK